MRNSTASYWGRGVLLVLGVCGWLAAKPAFGETYLIKEGKSCADIVIAEKPPRMVKLAAEELQAYIEKISGAKLAITNTLGSNVSAHIYVGRSTETDKLKITDEGLKHGAFTMVSGENWLALVGHDSDYTPPRYWSGGSLASAGFLAYLKLWDADMETWAQGKGVKLEGEKWSPPMPLILGGNTATRWGFGRRTRVVLSTPYTHFCGIWVSAGICPANWARSSRKKRASLFPAWTRPSGLILRCATFGSTLRILTTPAGMKYYGSCVWGSTKSGSATAEVYAMALGL